MANENKAAVIAAIWNNPEPAFNCRFRPSGKYLINERNGEYGEQGKIRIRLTASGENITVYYNGSSREEKTDVFTHLERYVLHTAGFYDTLKRLAEIYGLTLRYSEELRRKMNREMLAREVCPSLIESLRKNPTGAAGKYITETRGLAIDAHFGELTADSLNAAKAHLRNRGLSYSVEDWAALGLTEERARSGYNVVIPYYNNGNVIGFILRNITNNPNAPKYLYSQDMGRVGYCDRLKIGKPTFVVEGQMDAIRLTQAYATDADAPNVLAMGGAKISDDIAALLKRHNIDVVTYVPDVEYNDKGERKTDIITAAIQAFQAVKVEDEPVIKTLFISELETPEGVSLNGYKIDADTYGKENGNELLAVSVEGNATDWYIWELAQLEAWERTADSWDSWNVENNFRDRFRTIYNRAGVWDKQPIRAYIKANALYGKYGITPQVLDEADEWNKGKEYNNRIKAVSAELAKAVEDGANPVVIAKIAAQLNEAQSLNSRDDWNRQLNESFADELEAIKVQPETLKTKWELGVIRKDSPAPFRRTEYIEFYPADITVFCAPTSHGKTMILFQSALDMVREHPNKTFLYVSCEENKRQLLERALNVYIPIPNTPNGKDEQGNYCFLSKTRRKTIKAVLRNDTPPYEYSPFMNTSEHYDTIEPRIKGYIKQYGEQVRPRLKLIHSDATAESICSNIKQYVREAEERGEQVGAVFVDYIQLLSAENKHYSRHDELKTICLALRDCAAVTELPVIIAAQFNREGFKGGVDDLTVAHIGEAADIERIAHDIFLVWQTDKTNLSLYTKPIYATTTDKDGKVKQNTNEVVGHKVDGSKLGIRSFRLFSRGGTFGNEYALKTGCLYVEHLKARDGETGGWGLFPYNGESGQIQENNKDLMAE